MEEGEKTIRVYLSRRNLLTLLHKLEMDGSERTLTRTGHDGNLRRLEIVAEHDKRHYGDRVPGIVHSLTEAAIK